MKENVVYLRTIDDSYAGVIIGCKPVCVLNRKECAKIVLILEALAIPFEYIDTRET